MNRADPDALILADDWSELARHRQPEPVDDDRLHRWRLSRLRGQLDKTGAAMCLLVSPVSLRYAVNYRDYPLFQSHMPQAYVFFSAEGPTVVYGAMAGSAWVAEVRPGRPGSATPAPLETATQSTWSTGLRTRRGRQRSWRPRRLAPQVAALWEYGQF